MEPGGSDRHTKVGVFGFGVFFFSGSSMAISTLVQQKCPSNGELFKAGDPAPLVLFYGDDFISLRASA